MKTDPIWYFDATGNVLHDIPKYGKPFLYSIVAHDSNLNKIIPIAEFITTGHNQDNISSFLFHIKNHIKTPTKSLLPSIVVTDFSYALLNSVCETFNLRDLGDYIYYTFEILNNPNDQKRKELTILYLCSTHFLKMTLKRATKIFKKEKTPKVIQDIFKLTFTLFQNATTLVELFEIFEHFFNIFMKQKFDSTVKESITILNKKLVMRNISIQNIDLEAIDLPEYVYLKEEKVFI
jgi:hypothetical protein